MKSFRKRLVLSVIITLILLQFYPASLLIGVRGQSQNVFLSENIGYNCNCTVQRGYAKPMSSHTVRFANYDLGSGTHNITLVLQSNKSVIGINCAYGGAVSNRSSSSQSIITVITSASIADIQITLNNSVGNVPDPFDFLIEPWDTPILSLDESNQLKFTLKVNSTQFVQGASLSFVQPMGQATFGSCAFCGDLNITQFWINGNSAYFTVVNIKPGSYSEQFSLLENGQSGSLYVSLVKSSPDSFSFPVLCIVDGVEVEAQRSQIVSYSIPMISFSSSAIPWIYGYSDSSLWVVNFQSSAGLTLTIDGNSREMVDALAVGSTVNDFSVIETKMYDNPCYQLQFSLSGSCSSTLGLMVRQKVWFLRPSLIHAQDIPSYISQRYGVPNGDYWLCMDVNSNIVKTWVRQVIRNETNLYLIACDLFDNLSRNANYGESRWGNSNPPASEVLKANVTGVCRHFAYTYAALCIAAGVPARTVNGTAAGPGMWKLDHAWTEVYLPGYSWVPFDVTWDFFGKLPSSHIEYTLWPNVSVSYGSQYTSDQTLARSKYTLFTMVSICLNKIRVLQNGGFLGSSQVDELLQAQDLALQARILADSGSISLAIILACKSRIMIAYVESIVANSLIFVFSVVLLAVCPACYWEIKLLRSPQRLRKIMSDILPARLKRVGRTSRGRTSLILATRKVFGKVIHLWREMKAN